jgi:hypothetical protein
MRWTWDAVLFIVMTVAAFAGLIYGFIKWRRAPKDLPNWRRAVESVAFAIVIAQAGLFIAFWTPIGRDNVLLRQWSRWVLPTFLLALPFFITTKSPTRWWLLSSSFLLFVLCFFMTLTP